MAAVDGVLAIFEAGDLDALMDRVRFSRGPCEVPGIGVTASPICPPGVPEGSPVEAFPAASCQPYNVYSIDVVRNLADLAIARSVYVYAVFTTAAVAFDGAIPPAYAISLAPGSDGGAGPTVFIDREGAAVMLYSGCSEQGESIPEGAEFILPPK